MDRNELYSSIAARTGGDIYIGVVGPVRTGKSTFIKRFMDMLVIPTITDEYERARLTDELPQSAAGRSSVLRQTVSPALSAHSQRAPRPEYNPRVIFALCCRPWS